MRSISTTNLTQRLLALVAVFALVIAACGDDDSAALGGEDSRTAIDQPADGAMDRDASGDEGGGDGAAEEPQVLGSGGVTPLVQSANFGREIIYTADLTVAVDDVAAAGVEATRIVAEFDGLLFGQQTEGLPNPRSVLVFKVQPEDFQAALDALGSIGEIRTQNISADDVTEIVIDLQSRIETAETSVERLRGFLENATTITDIAEIEGQLVERESMLESMRGRLRTLQDQVSLATITLTLTEAFAAPQIQLLTSAYLGDDDGLSCPGAENLGVDKGDTAWLCFELRNDGDTALTGFTLIDTVLDLELGDLTVIDGDPAGDLQPGQSILLATPVEVERRIRTRTTVTAVPVNQDGTAIEARKVSSSGSVVLRAEEAEGLPGFDDGVRVATDILRWMGGVVVLAAGLIVPFLWLIPLLALFWWWRRRRRDIADDVIVVDVGQSSQERHVDDSDLDDEEDLIDEDLDTPLG
jgi:hypothetical protein